MKKELTIEEGNRLIAEFMGLFGGNVKYPFTNPYNGVHHIEAKFNSSWDWLMPVVEKIEGKEVDLNVSVVIKNDKCRIYRHKNSLYEMTVSDLHEGTTKIEATWKAIIDFIQWYNQNTKP